MRIRATGLALILGTGAAGAQTLTEAWRAEGFTMPESAYWDEALGRVVVSQIGAFGPDGGTDGKLSLLTPEGEVEAADWVTGLIDPKGMASHGGKLYVADANGLAVVDEATGAVERTVELPGAQLPNDVAVDAGGSVYVTDMMGGALYRVAPDGSVDQIVGAGGASLPNGVAIRDGRVLLGSFGAGMQPDFTVQTLGGLFEVDPATGTVSPVKGTEETASVDGIALLGGRLFYNDNPTGRVFELREGGATEVGNTGPGSGDMGASPDLLLVPSLGGGTVTAYRIE